ncbi:MAG: gamma-glutamyl-gamma-aminobutyrate hydrolase family protein [Bacillota bacterium]
MPIIGITCAQDNALGRVFLADYYYRAIENAGGSPVLLPPVRNVEKIRSIVEWIDGLLLSGGSDVDPVFFGEEPLPGTGEITPERDWMEITATQTALAAGLPVLGICRGIQVLNIAAGGNIYQDIRGTVAKIKHNQEAPRWYATHSVKILPESLLADITARTSLRVNSFHHQAVRDVAPGFRAVAWAADGIIEAIEYRSPDARFALGVQWHPEVMWERETAHYRLFARFVAAAYKRSRKE